jgi:hypothetical protein
VTGGVLTPALEAIIIASDELESRTCDDCRRFGSDERCQAPRADDGCANTESVSSLRLISGRGLMSVRCAVKGMSFNNRLMSEDRELINFQRPVAADDSERDSSYTC